MIGLGWKDKLEILRKFRVLKQNDDHYKDIYFNVDLTPNQQEEAKKLRDELKRRKECGELDIVIYRGEIVQRSQIKNFH